MSDAISASRLLFAQNLSEWSYSGTVQCANSWIRTCIIEFTEVYYDDQVIDGEPEWHYNPREYTAHIQIVRDEEKCLHMNTRQYLDHVTDKAELILDSFLFKTLIADGYFHWAYSHPGGKSTQQWTIIKLD